jgi:hypothetical protein
MAQIVSPSKRDELARISLGNARFIVGVLPRGAGNRAKHGVNTFYVSQVAEYVQISSGKYVDGGAWIGIVAKPPIGSRRPTTCEPVVATFFGTPVPFLELAERYIALEAEPFDLVETYRLDGSVTRCAFAELDVASYVASERTARAQQTVSV